MADVTPMIGKVCSSHDSPSCESLVFLLAGCEDWLHNSVKQPLFKPCQRDTGAHGEEEYFADR